MKEKALLSLGAVAAFLLLAMLNCFVPYVASYGRFCRAAAFFGPSPACAGEQNESPYGSSRGGTYGEKRQVGTKDDARKLLREYFSNRDVTIGEIREKQYYFEADIMDMSGKLIDKVIVDKRTGRIRSIY